MTAIEFVSRPGLAAVLKGNTAAAHERLDAAVMAAEPFASVETYCRFLRVQQAFHRKIDALYSNRALDALRPDLAGRRRLPLIDQDFADLGLASLPARGTAAFVSGAVDIPTALGWLYVAEGSNLGAAILLKLARGLDLSEDFGARRLAPASEGRGLHWRTFLTALDAVELSETEAARVVAGAHAGFSCVSSAASVLLPPK